MKIQTINFNNGMKRYSFAAAPQSKNNGQIAPIQQKPAGSMVNFGNKMSDKDNLIKYSLIGTALLLSGIFIFKGKSVSKLFKKKTEPLKPTKSENHINPSTSDKPTKVETEQKTAKPVILQGRYELCDEYEKRTNAILDFYKKLGDKKRTPEDFAKIERLEKEKQDLINQIIQKHQSVVKIKVHDEFPDMKSEDDYILNYAIPRIPVSSESAIDALTVYKKMGSQIFDYYKSAGFDIDPSLSSTHNGLVTNWISEQILSLPKQCKTDSVLLKYSEVIPSNTIKNESKEMVKVFKSFIESGNISENALARSIRIGTFALLPESKNLETIINKSKYKDSKIVRDALAFYKDTVKLYGPKSFD